MGVDERGGFVLGKGSKEERRHCLSDLKRFDDSGRGRGGERGERRREGGDQRKKTVSVNEVTLLKYSLF